MHRAPAARALTTAIACALISALACGGKSDATQAANDASAGSSGTGGSGAAGSGGFTTGGNGGSGGSGGSGTNGASGTAPDGSGGSTPDGSDSSTTGPRRVTCDGAPAPAHECNPGEYCCDNQCTSEDLPCKGARILCDDAGDCPNAFCCVTKISKRDGGPQVASCRTSCDADTELVLCRHSGASDDCPPGMQCQITATLPPLYGYCCPPATSCPTT